MTNSLNILLVSRKKEVLHHLERLLSAEGISTRQQLNSNGHVDPLHGTEIPPDLVVLHLSHLWREELEAYMARPANRRPPLILLSGSQDMNVMRLALQAGARDVLPTPPSQTDLLEAVERITLERQATGPQSGATITAFMNAKGGCGATLLACNVAHMLTVQSKKRVALFDLDLQFGAAPLYLDLFPKRGVAQAVQNLSELDEVALDGYLARHSSGLHVLSRAADEPIGVTEVSASAAERLIDIAIRSHDHLVIDIPRHVDEMSSAVVSRSHQTVVVLQQSVTALRDAARLLQWLRGDLGLTRDQLTVVINRFEKGAPISVTDIQKSLACDEPLLVPNDFQSASECVNTGTPLLTYARNAAITKALMSLETRLGGSSKQSEGGLFSRTWSSIVSGRTR